MLKTCDILLNASKNIELIYLGSFIIELKVAVEVVLHNWVVSCN